MTIKNLSEKVTLELVAENKFYKLSPGASPDDRFEATGVANKGDNFLVVFDDTPHFSRVDTSLTAGHESNCLYRNMGKAAGYQDITYDGRGQRFLALTQGKKRDDGSTKARINQFDPELAYVEGRYIDYDVKGNERLLQGIAAIWRGNQLSILAICSGNKCSDGKKGRTPGGGRIHVFQPETGMWAHKGTMRLPKDLPFSDYVSLEVRGNRLAVLSQASSAVWIATLQEGSWGFVDDGVIYCLPPSKKGNNIYCTVEGITWVDDNKLAAVSDSHRGRRQNKRCAKREQSIHIFQIPDEEVT